MSCEAIHEMPVPPDHQTWLDGLRSGAGEIVAALVTVAAGIGIGKAHEVRRQRSQAVEKLVEEAREEAELRQLLNELKQMMERTDGGRVSIHLVGELESFKKEIHGRLDVIENNIRNRLNYYDSQLVKERRRRQRGGPDGQ